MTIKEAKILTELGIHIVEEREVEECDLCGKKRLLSEAYHGEEKFMVCDDCADYCSSVNTEQTYHSPRKVRG